MTTRRAVAPSLRGAEATVSKAGWIQRIADPEIRAGVEAAVDKNLLPAATERVYPGHFTINADGGGFGNDPTWPGLDSWQMIGPYLQLGRTRMVLDYFEFVRASQRKDGNIPFAIFNGHARSMPSARSRHCAGPLETRPRRKPGPVTPTN